MSQKYTYESTLGPEVLYYNIIYHVRQELERQGLEPINKDLEKVIHTVIQQNVRGIDEWEHNTKE